MSERSADGRKRSEAGELQREVLRVVTRLSQCTIRDVHEQLLAERQIAYTTVQTTMMRLSDQGLLTRSKRGKIGIFRPATSDDSVRAGRLADDLLGRYGPTALVEFVDRARANPELFEQLRALVDQEHDQQSGA